MKSILRVLAVVTVAALLAFSVAPAQDLSETLNKIGKDNVSGYLAPLLAGWSADLNSGFYHSADLHDILGFDVGIKFAVAQVGDADKVMDFTLPATMKYRVPSTTTDLTLVGGTNYDRVTTGASTAVGGKGGKSILLRNMAAPYTALNGQVLMMTPDGFDTPAIPMIMPQAAIGLPLGLEAIIRFVPSTKLGDFGKVSFTGFGVRYDIDQWIPLFPIDIAAHFMTQSFKLVDNNDKEVLSASAVSYGVEVSKKLLFITAYAGFDLQKSSFTVGAIDGNMNSNGALTPYHLDSFTVDGKNTSRAVVGLRLLLLIVNVHAEYSIASQPMMTLGVGLSLR